MNSRSNLGATLWRLFKPQPEGFVIWVIVLLFGAAIALFQLISGGTIGSDSKEVITSATGILRHATGLLDTSSSGARLLLFGFWFVVGCLLYFLVWFGINIVIDFYNDLVISSSFMHPRSFNQSSYWAAITGRVIVRGLAGLALIIVVIIGLKVILSGYISATTQLLRSVDSSNIIVFASSALIIGFAVHLAFVLFKVAFLRLRDY